MAKNRRRCFLDMSIDGRDAGRIVFELFDDLGKHYFEGRDSVVLSSAFWQNNAKFFSTKDY